MDRAQCADCSQLLSPERAHRPRLRGLGAAGQNCTTLACAGGFQGEGRGLVAKLLETQSWVGASCSSVRWQLGKWRGRRSTRVPASAGSALQGPAASLIVPLIMWWEFCHPPAAFLMQVGQHPRGMWLRIVATNSTKHISLRLTTCGAAVPWFPMYSTNMPKLAKAPK